MNLAFGEITVLAREERIGLNFRSGLLARRAWEGCGGPSPREGCLPAQGHGVGPSGSTLAREHTAGPRRRPHPTLECYRSRAPAEYPILPSGSTPRSAPRKEARSDARLGRTSAGGWCSVRQSGAWWHHWITRARSRSGSFASTVERPARMRTRHHFPSGRRAGMTGLSAPTGSQRQCCASCHSTTQATSSGWSSGVRPVGVRIRRSLSRGGSGLVLPLAPRQVVPRHEPAPNAGRLPS